LCGVVLLLAAPEGCTKKPLQELDGGGIGPIGGTGDGGIQINVDGAVGDVAGTADAVGIDTGGGGFDAAFDAPSSGLLSFNVTSQLRTEAGFGPSHDFTMTLDLRRQIAVIGTPGWNDVVPIEQTGSNTVRLRLGGGATLGFGVPVTGVCGASAIYSDMSLVIGTVNGLLGTGAGQLTTYDPALSHSVAATMTLSGVVDTEPPTLTLSAGGALTEPWTPLWLVSSDPLATQQAKPTLRSFGGDVVPLGAPTGMEMYASLFAKPARMLRFGDEYEVSFAGLTDLAGNAAAASGTGFNTQPAPPLIVTDGFESAAAGTVSYGQILSSADAPTISGARSLYIPPAESLGTAGRVTQLAVRVPVPPGATVIRFAYRSVNPGDDFGTYFIIGSEGGTIGTASVSPAPGAATPATIGQTQVMLGPVATATIGLPADAQGEVVLARSAAQPTSCGGPAPQPVPGMIIDDLRAE
jgi:hypothetical protein